MHDSTNNLICVFRELLQFLNTVGVEFIHSKFISYVSRLIFLLNGK